MKRRYIVLLADDDKVQTMMLSTQLRTRGYSIVAAYDATYTMRVAMKTPPDVVVLDIQMPGGTGRAVLERLKSSSKTMNIPIVVLSGLTDPALPAQVVALGANEFLAKPVDVDLLDAAIKRALGVVETSPPDAPPAPAAPEPPTDPMPRT